MFLTRYFEPILESRLKEKAPLLQILIGPRQVGKTTAATSIYNRWEDPKLLISADNTSHGKDWLEWNWRKALDMGGNCLLIIDEVQKVPGWSEQIKILFDKERGKGNLKILLLGSSSLYLQKGIAESLAGRFELTTASHWSFKEYKDYFKSTLDNYIKFGSYPAANEFANDEARWRNYILNSIIEPVLGKDILTQHPISNPALFRQCFQLAVSFPAQVISYQKMLGQLQERGNASTIKHYLNLLEKTFLIKSIFKYSGSQIQEKTSSPKIIVLNPAITNAYYGVKKLETTPEWYGHVFESLIGAHLLLVPNSNLYYWKKGNFEVDFVLVENGKIRAIEVKSGFKRKSSGLNQFYKEYPKSICEIWEYKDCIDFISI